MGKTRRCCIPGCKSTTLTMTLFKFPYQRQLSAVWENILRKKYPNVKLKRALDGRCHQLCCILHFEAKYLHSTSQRIRFAIPTLFTQSEIDSRNPAQPISLSWKTTGNINSEQLGDGSIRKRTLISTRETTGQIHSKSLTLQGDNGNICKQAYTSIDHDHEYVQNTKLKLNFGKLAENNENDSEVKMSDTPTTEQPIAETHQVALSQAISFLAEHNEDESELHTSDFTPTTEQPIAETHQVALSQAISYLTEHNKNDSEVDTSYLTPTTEQPIAETYQVALSPAISYLAEHNEADSELDTSDFTKITEQPIAETYQVALSQSISYLPEHNEHDSEVDTSNFTLTTEQPTAETQHVALSQAISYQKFRDVDWRKINYTETQKQFEAYPAFSALKLNNLLSVLPMQESDNILERCDLTLGAITNGLIQQRIAFEGVLNSLPEEMKIKLGQEFITANSHFKKTSDSLLRYVCGRRAEVIQDRREAFQPYDKALKRKLHEIPPSETHLFDDKIFSERFQ